MSADLLALLATTSTSIVADALDGCGLRGFCEGIVPVTAGRRAFGRAYTVRVSPHGIRATSHDEYMEDLSAGDVCMLDARTVREGAVWGDLRSIVAQRRGVAAAIADGWVRDTDACSALGFPVFARAASPVSGSGRAWIEAKAVPIVIGGVHVAPGDYVLADGDGAVVVPAEAANAVHERAAALDAADRRMVAALAEGMPLAEARRAFGAKKTLPAR